MQNVLLGIAGGCCLVGAHYANQTKGDCAGNWTMLLIFVGAFFLCLAVL